MIKNIYLNSGKQKARSFHIYGNIIEYTRVALGCTLPPVWLVPMST